jgi:transcriptional regulator with XRE-family HTH domain
MFLLQLFRYRGDLFVSDDQAKALGKLLRDRRKELGYSTYDVAEAAGVNESTVVRFEQGRFVAPRPNKLVRFAQALGISLADLYAKAGYLLPKDLPTFGTYLQIKYPRLPKKAVIELTRHFKRLMTAHKLPLDGSAAPPTPPDK